MQCDQRITAILNSRNICGLMLLLLSLPLCARTAVFFDRMPINVQVNLPAQTTVETHKTINVNAPAGTTVIYQDTTIYPNEVWPRHRPAVILNLPARQCFLNNQQSAANGIDPRLRPCPIGLIDQVHYHQQHLTLPNGYCLQGSRQSADTGIVQMVPCHHAPALWQRAGQQLIHQPSGLCLQASDGRLFLHQCQRINAQQFTEFE
ncbi:ricin-type beta-trefoil lectin domain protein [Neisseriaceae bacterium ESL0693]|nr:ricin-type beta-trefoil lectin domain protein [Neisseriaceae bacterium ESL0693]